MLKRIFVFVLIVISIITLAACSQKITSKISTNYDSQTGKMYVKNLSDGAVYSDISLSVEYYDEDNSKRTVTYEIGSLNPGEEKIIETEEHLGKTTKKAYVKEVIYSNVKDSVLFLILIVICGIMLLCVISVLIYEHHQKQKLHK